VSTYDDVWLYHLSPCRMGFSPDGPREALEFDVDEVLFGRFRLRYDL
jgi:hypothetical protein